MVEFRIPERRECLGMGRRKERYLILQFFYKNAQWLWETRSPCHSSVVATPVFLCHSPPSLLCILISYDRKGEGNLCWPYTKCSESQMTIGIGAWPLALPPCWPLALCSVRVGCFITVCLSFPSRNQKHTILQNVDCY